MAVRPDESRAVRVAVGVFHEQLAPIFPVPERAPRLCVSEWHMLLVVENAARSPHVAHGIAVRHTTVAACGIDLSCDIRRHVLDKIRCASEGRVDG